MQKKDLEKFKNLLNKELEELKKQLSNVSQQNKDVKGDWVPVPDMKDDENISDENDMVHREGEFINHQAISNQLEIRLENINIALNKIKNGEYGVCEISGHPIEKERLLANPAARTCLMHKNKNV